MRTNRQVICNTRRRLKHKPARQGRQDLEECILQSFGHCLNVSNQAKTRIQVLLRLSVVYLLS